MSKLKINSKELRAIGYPDGPAISLAMSILHRHYKHERKEPALNLLRQVLETPEAYAGHQWLGPVARQLLPKATTEGAEISLNKQGVRFNVFGQEHIEEIALHQMYQAARLPVSVTGALMPDAHSGYGLPIGGVLATDNAVIPYGVGVDIGCRMSLSLFDIAPKELKDREDLFARILDESTLFGSGAQFLRAADHEVMEHELFYSLPLLKRLQGRAWKQLGSSGSGNHFAEFGVVTISETSALPGIAPGLYTGLLTHSGSRALGAMIANHYTKIAIGKRRLPQDTKNLAWLGLDEAEGMEYWAAMNLAGDYAEACHQVIHTKISRLLGRKALKQIGNHHNFAWKEQWESREVIVHRKGATPAGKDVLGIIPGSMTADGFIVRGKGEAGAVHSAAHGAGRRMSRGRAIASISDKEFRDELKKYGVKLLGGGLDESPFAYKDIADVMRSQRSLVDIVGRFTPKIVKMDGAKHHSWKGRQAGE